MPRFSLVVPTLRRSDTLEHTLATLLAQPETELEIVVQNNGNDHATRELVERLNDPRLRLFHTDEVVPMVDNWERALSNSTGDFVTFLGDDDGLFPDACLVAASILADGDTEILSWAPFLYLWPGYWDEPRRNRLQATVSFEFGVRLVHSRPLLRRFYDFEAHYSQLPMLYNSFVGRSLIERVQDRHGKYFVGSLPDVTSGIVNAAFCETFLRSSRPLSVAGVSQHSMGHRMTRTTERLSQADWRRDFPDLAERASEAGSNLELLIADEMQLVGEQVFRDSEPVTLNELGLVRAIAAAINDSPSRYDETRSSILGLMERFGIKMEEVAIPTRQAHPSAPADGVHVLGPDEVLFVLDGNRLGLRSITDAVSLASQLAPGAELLVRVESAEEVPALSEQPLAFAKHSSGEHALVSGWGVPESWGAWSVDRRSLLRLRIPPSTRDGAFRLGLRYRTIPFPDGRPRVVECAVGERTLQRWEFVADTCQGEVVADVPSESSRDSVLELTFVNVNAESPQAMGLSNDIRRLGIGVEQIRLLASERTEELETSAEMSRTTSRLEDASDEQAPGGPLPTYDADFLVAYHKDLGFLHDPRFRAAYRRGMDSGHHIVRDRGSDEDIHIEWRVHVLLWAAAHALRLAGDFVECGVNTGIYSLAVCDYVDFNTTGRAFWLFDTFAGIPLDQVTERERELGRLAENEAWYSDCFELARANFAPFPRAKLVRGKVPDTLATVEIGSVAYLSIDMNIVEPEVAALAFFWEKLTPGAPVILDDYGWSGHRPQREAMDAVAAERGVEILSLPTGQGIILKPPS
jgi:hypothetical protein